MYLDWVDCIELRASETRVQPVVSATVMQSIASNCHAIDIALQRAITYRMNII